MAQAGKYKILGELEVPSAYEQHHHRKFISLCCYAYLHRSYDHLTYDISSLRAFDHTGHEGFIHGNDWFSARLKLSAVSLNSGDMSLRGKRW